MNIPEVASLEMKALSRDRITVGCAEFSRPEVLAVKKDMADRFTGHTTFDYRGNYYWVTVIDCTRALRLMYEWQEPKPEPKSKVGDWVRWAGRQILRVEKFDGPVIIGRTLKNDEWRAYPDGLGSYCLESWQPQVGDFVRCTNPSHPGPNPFKVCDPKGRNNSDLFYSEETIGEQLPRHGPDNEEHYWHGCKPEWLVPAEEPKAETPPLPIGNDWEMVWRSVRGGRGYSVGHVERLLISLYERVARLEAK